jgi:hypothetical protein
MSKKSTQLRDRLREAKKKTKKKTLKEHLDKPKPYDGAVKNTDISESRPSLRSTASFLYEEGPDKSLADEDDRHSKDDNLPPDTNTQKGVPSTGSSGDHDRKISPKTKTDFRTRQYCTQACLLTLKRG